MTSQGSLSTPLFSIASLILMKNSLKTPCFHPFKHHIMFLIQSSTLEIKQSLSTYAHRKEDIRIAGFMDIRIFIADSS